MLSHQGGWDEILTVLIPIAVVGLVAWLAARRAAATDSSVDQQDQAPELTDE